MRGIFSAILSNTVHQFSLFFFVIQPIPQSEPRMASARATQTKAAIAANRSIFAWTFDSPTVVKIACVIERAMPLWIQRMHLNRNHKVLLRVTLLTDIEIFGQQLFTPITRKVYI
mmetsp:Transcript_2478/g.3629  ORF Transcript_2478/g.3629 Transcript_2478/m.3629 type:complete len:115 (+) Transcript_2478:1261-1605(+)